MGLNSLYLGSLMPVLMANQNWTSKLQVSDEDNNLQVSMTTAVIPYVLS